MLERPATLRDFLPLVQHDLTRDELPTPEESVAGLLREGWTVAQAHHWCDEAARLDPGVLEDAAAGRIN